jgi:hypothetical protein
VGFKFPSPQILKNFQLGQRPAADSVDGRSLDCVAENRVPGAWVASIYKPYSYAPPIPSTWSFNPPLASPFHPTPTRSE